MESGRGTVMVRVCLDLVGLGIDIFGECVGVTPFPASLDEEDPHNEQDKTEDDGNGLGVAADYETRAIGLFHSINEHLTLVAEYNQFEIEDRTNSVTIEETDSVALGVALSW